MSGTGPRAEILTVITRMNVGGPARLVTVLAGAAPELGRVILTGMPEPDEGSLEAEAAAAGIRLVHVPGLVRPVSPLNDLRALVFLTRYFRRERPNAVATHMAKAGTLGRLASLLAGVPARVHTFHGHVLEGYFGPIATRAFRFVERWLARRTDRIVAVSPQIADELHRLGITERPIDIVRVGIPLDQLASARGGIRHELGWDGSPLIGFFGRLVAIKDPLLFVEAAALIATAHPEARFIVAGDGDLRRETELAAAAAGLGDRMRFLGFRADVERLLPDLDVLVLTSRKEGTPLSVIEAAAAGVPTVATNVGGLADIIRDGENGILVPAGDAGAIAGAVRGLIRDGAERRRLGAAARRQALAEYGADTAIREMRKVYRAVLSTEGTS